MKNGRWGGWGEREHTSAQPNRILCLSSLAQRFSWLYNTEKSTSVLRKSDVHACNASPMLEACQ